MRLLRPLATAALALCALVAIPASSAPAAGPTMAFGAAEDAVRQDDPAVARQKMAQLAAAGFRAVRITSLWVPPATAPTPGEITVVSNVAAAAKAYGVTLYVSVLSPGSKTTPLTPEAQAQFAQYASALVRTVPSLRNVIVGNEPNLNRFWLPQFNQDGTDAAAPAYETLLAQTYDAIKAANPAVTVYGGALAPRGVDKPGTGRDTHSPVAFIADLGAAYRASGRTAPIMDGFAFHPYGEASNVPPTLQHPKSTSLGISDYDRLVGLLGQAFDGTAQAGSTLPILYDEYGVESTIPETKASSYTGNEPTTTHPVDETAQAATYEQALEIAYCQPNVVGVLLFHSQDEAALASWQSGVYYADGTPKASLWAVRGALDRARGGSLAHCADLSLDVTATTLRFPKPALLSTGTAAIQVVCPLDCAATLTLTRLADGKVVYTRKAYALAREPLSVPLRKLRLRPGQYAWAGSFVQPVNPGTPQVRQGAVFSIS